MGDRQKRLEEVIQRLINEDSEPLALAWNRLSDERGWGRLRDMDDFNEVFAGQTPIEIAEHTHDEDFIPIESYFWVDFHGYAHTFDYLACSGMDAGDLARYAIARDDDFGIPEIRDVLAD